MAERAQVIIDVDGPEPQLGFGTALNAALHAVEGVLLHVDEVLDATGALREAELQGASQQTLRELIRAAHYEVSDTLALPKAAAGASLEVARGLVADLQALIEGLIDALGTQVVRAGIEVLARVMRSLAAALRDVFAAGSRAWRAISRAIDRTAALVRVGWAATAAILRTFARVITREASRFKMYVIVFGSIYDAVVAIVTADRERARRVLAIWDMALQTTRVDVSRLDALTLAALNGSTRALDAEFAAAFARAEAALPPIDGSSVSTSIARGLDQLDNTLEAWLRSPAMRVAVAVVDDALTGTAANLRADAARLVDALDVLGRLAGEQKMVALETARASASLALAWGTLADVSDAAARSGATSALLAGALRRAAIAAYAAVRAAIEAALAVASALVGDVARASLHALASATFATAAGLGALPAPRVRDDEVSPTLAPTTGTGTLAIVVSGDVDVDAADAEAWLRENVYEPVRSGGRERPPQSVSAAIPTPRLPQPDTSFEARDAVFRALASLVPGLAEALGLSRPRRRRLVSGRRRRRWTETVGDVFRQLGGWTETVGDVFSRLGGWI